MKPVVHQEPGWVDRPFPVPRSRQPPDDVPRSPPVSVVNWSNGQGRTSGSGLRCGEIGSSRSAGRMSQSGVADAPTNLETKGRHGRSGLGSQFRRTICRTGWRDPLAAVARREGERAALLVLSGRARRGERTPVCRGRCPWPADVCQQVLLDPLPGLRLGSRGAQPVPTGVVRLHHEARAAHRPADRPVAKRSGTRPDTRASRRPSLEQRTGHAVGVGLTRTTARSHAPGMLDSARSPHRRCATARPSCASPEDETAAQAP